MFYSKNGTPTSISGSFSSTMQTRESLGSRLRTHLFYYFVTFQIHCSSCHGVRIFNISISYLPELLQIIIIIITIIIIIIIIIIITVKI